METQQLQKFIEENNRLLKQNNFLLHKIIKQNQLMFTITQKNILYFSWWRLWGESSEVKNLRKELEKIHNEITEFLNKEKS